MVAAPIHHINLNERGVAYIAGTSMKVAHIAIDAETWGMTPQQIRDNYPHLSLAQIHAALAYHYDHKDTIDAQIALETEEYERLRAESPNPFTREQLHERWQRRQRGERPE
jgi:uncharacterized protein (DUF433 family)